MKICQKSIKIDLQETQNDVWNLLFLFSRKYLEMIEYNQEIIKNFNASQHTLLSFHYLDCELCNGGFIQLIQNGYGKYVFDTPFSETIKSWGVKRVCKIVEKGQKIYEKHRIKIEKEKSLEDFSELYSEITDFEPLEDEYYEVKEREMEIIKNYVEKNIVDFAIIDENNTQPSLIESDNEMDDFITSLIEQDKQKSNEK